MFKSYQDIFNQRGALYHQGMLKYPLARIDEFNQLIELADLCPGQVVCDVPSGGCYISNFIEPSVDLVSVETSQEFIKESKNTSNNTIVVCEDIASIPIRTGTFDRVVSLAGLHHVDDKQKFYKESFRLLKPRGIFCVADALEGSKVAQFLNVFVDENNSMGHKGDFFTGQVSKELESVGFDVVHNGSIAYHWHFASIESMVDYCRLLFGIDKASNQQVLEGIEKYLGYVVNDDQCFMNWELYFLKGLKAG